MSPMSLKGGPADTFIVSLLFLLLLSDFSWSTKCGLLGVLIRFAQGDGPMGVALRCALLAYFCWNACVPCPAQPRQPPAPRPAAAPRSERAAAKDDARRS